VKLRVDRDILAEAVTWTARSVPARPPVPALAGGTPYPAPQAAEALATGWAEFIALGKTLLINPHWAELTEQGRDDDIQTEIDPERADSYRLPARMLGLTLQGTQAWLPPVKGMERKILDI